MIEKIRHIEKVIFIKEKQQLSSRQKEEKRQKRILSFEIQHGRRH